MKMKRLFTALVSLLVIFAIAGCSNGNNSSQASTASNGSGQAGNGGGNGFAKPDVYGEVANINGNQVTLKLMVIPQRNGRNGQNGGNWKNGQNGQNGQNNGNASAGGGNGAGGPGGRRARQYTGQEKTMVIPNGTSIVTMSRGSNGMTQNQVSMSDITVGSVLSIYYKTDGKTINNIRVMKPMNFGGQGANGNASTNTSN